MSFLSIYRKKHRISERDLAFRSQLSRETIRKAEKNFHEIKVSHLHSLADTLDLSLLIHFTPMETCFSELSTVAVSMNIIKDGFDSWKLHFMDLVDEFRRTLDIRLLLLPPVKNLDIRLKALLSGIVLNICEDAQIEAPPWVNQEIFLEKPWFVSGMESLKATAILETPFPFRRHNIFVQENFLSRV